MTLFWKRVIICALGVLAGVLVWPVMELFLAQQTQFPNYLVFSVASGAAFGLLFGVFLGTAEGIIAGSNHRIMVGAGTGAALGLLGGMLGFVVGQAVLFVVGEFVLIQEQDVRAIGFPLARALGWAVLGLFVGSTEGIRVRSLRKLAMGVAGGFLGGFLGGAVIEYGSVHVEQAAVVRFAGLVLLGAAIALFHALIERQLSLGVLRLLNGRFKGKEFVINQRRAVIGSGAGADFIIKGYRDVLERHARLRYKNHELYIEPLEPQQAGGVLVNNRPIAEQRLKYEDVIKIGSAKLFFRHE